VSRLLDPDSADLTLLQDRQVAVLGYDAMAAAHALNLRDSGVDVRVGIDPDSRAAGRAELDGLMVLSPTEAVAACDIVLLAAEDGAVPGLTGAALQTLLEEHTEPGDMVIVTGATGPPSVPDGVDLAMLAAVGDGDRVREEYLDGRGSPALVAIARDESGAAWATLTAYAAAMGSLRSGAVITTLEHQSLAQDLSERRVHMPLLQALTDTFDELVQQGVEEEVAYLAVVHDLKTRVDAIYVAGLAAQHGPDGHPGDQPLDGARSRREAARAAHPLERVGQRVRAMMSWIR
jgi:ketol-acid reductoisomerase